MTRRQKLALEAFRRQAIYHFFFDHKPEGESKYEFKKWDVEENEYFVSLVLEVGLIGDEGTMAEVFARYRCHLHIGKRGGVRYYVPFSITERRSKDLWTIYREQSDYSRRKKK